MLSLYLSGPFETLHSSAVGPFLREIVWEGCAGAPMWDAVCARMVDKPHARGKTLPTITSKAHMALRLRRVCIIDSTHLVFVLRVPMRILVGKADIARFPIERDAERGIKRLHVMQDVRGRRPGRLRTTPCGFEGQRMVFVAGEA